MARKLKGKKEGKGLKLMLVQQKAIDKFNKSKATKTEHQKKLKEQQKRNQTGQTKKAKILAARAINGTSSKAARRSGNEKYIPFESNETLMLVGEGDFSYARSLIVNSYIKPENLVVTSYDSGVKELTLKYPHSFKKNYDFLVESHVAIFFKIDVTKLIKSFKISKRKSWAKVLPGFANKKLDYIMFNFPHNGKGVKDQDRNIADHQNLMALFFRNCMDFYKLINTKKDNKCLAGYEVSSNEQFFSPEGKVILSVFEGEPYDSWQVKVFGKTNGGWKVERSNKFQWENYPEYHHKRTNNEMDTTKPAAERPARIYLFEKSTGDKRKKNRNDESDSDSD